MLLCNVIFLITQASKTENWLKLNVLPMSSKKQSPECQKIRKLKFLLLQISHFILSVNVGFRLPYVALLDNFTPSSPHFSLKGIWILPTEDEEDVPQVEKNHCLFFKTLRKPISSVGYTEILAILPIERYLEKNG